MRLRGKVAVVTGAGSGIGRAIALEFAREGARVVIAEWNERSGLEVAQSIEKQSGEAMAVVTDVSQSDSVARLFNAVDARGWATDILINNAGTVGP